MTSAHGALVSKRRAQKLAQHLAETIPSNKRILDIGSGNGRLAKLILDLRPDLQIHGIDINIDSGSAIPIDLYDGKTIPFDTDSWDICMASDVLHHCDDPIAVLQEMSRVAKESIVLKDHVADNRFSRMLLITMDWIGNVGYGTKVPFNFFSSTEWLQAYAELGLTQVRSKKNLRLYPYPFTWLLDGNLHFVTLLAVKQ